MSKVRTAVIPVAGLGTRFLPMTKAIPKELLPLVDKPVVQFIVEEAKASGIEEVIFITSGTKATLEQYFGSDAVLEQFLQEKGKKESLQMVRDVQSLARFTYIRQEQPLGLGHAVLLAREAVGDEPFIVFGGDDVIESAVPAARQLMDVYDQHQGSVVGVMEVSEEQVNRYGIIDPQVDPKEELSTGVYRLNGIVEKPDPSTAPSRLAAGGRWLLTSDIFPYLEHATPSADGEIQLTDALCAMAAAQPVYAFQYDGIYRDCGNKLEYIKAVVSVALKHPAIGSDVRDYLQTLLKE